MTTTRTPEEREALRLQRASFPKCACGNTLGLTVVQTGGKKCRRCVDVEGMAKNSLYACKCCGAAGLLGDEFSVDTFGGDVEVTCVSCKSTTDVSLATLAITDLLAEVKRLREAGAV